MSLPETFLRGGTPCRTVEDWKKFSSSYLRWRWVVCFPRLWSLDIRRNSLSSPVLHLLFGSNPQCTENVRDPEISSWHLLLFHPNHQCLNVLKSGLHTIMKPYIKETPLGLLPQQLDVMAIVKGTTHEKIGLLTEDLWKSSCARIQDCFQTNSGATNVSVTVFSVVKDPLEVESGNNVLSGETFEAVAWGAMSWVQKKYTLEELVDASYPALSPSPSMIELLFHLNPLLYRGIFVSTVAHNDMTENDALLLNACNDTSTIFGSSALPTSLGSEERLQNGKLEKLKESKKIAAQTLKKKVGECITFSFSVPIGSTSLSKTMYALLWQRPVVMKLENKDLTNLDPGPLSPQALSGELHIYTDRGEPLYLQQFIRDAASALDFCFEDILHEDGELFVQLSPIEGIPFDVVDDFLIAVEEKLEFCNTKIRAKDGVAPFSEKTPLVTDCPTASQLSPLFSSEPFLSESCCGFVFPRVVRRLPTGNTAKLNPMTRSRSEVKLFPPTSDDVKIAMVALETLSQHICPVSQDAGIHEEIKRENDGGSHHIHTSGSHLQSPQKYTVDSNSLPEIFFPPSRCSLQTSFSGATVVGNVGSTPSCEWCHRRLEKLLQCSGCKMVFYCGKRHQAMDWKERRHRIECKWWKKGWEAMKSELSLVTLQQAISEPWRTTSFAVSCSTTSFSFLQATVQNWKQNINDGIKFGLSSVQRRTKNYFLLYVLLRDLTLTAPSNSDVNVSASSFTKEFLNSLSQQYSQKCKSSTHINGSTNFSKSEETVCDALASTQDEISCLHLQIRCVLVCNHFSESERNEVWALQGENSEAVLRSPTGVLGDIWREGNVGASAVLPSPIGTGHPSSSRPHVLCRVTNSSMSELLPSHAAIPHKGEMPDAVISFGPCNGVGLSYLTSSVEVAADQLVGVVPTRWIESSYVGSLRTQRALSQRVTNSIITPLKIKQYIQDNSKNTEVFPVKTNYSGILCALHYNKGDNTSKSSASPAEQTSTAVPIFPNAYEFDFPVLSEI